MATRMACVNCRKYFHIKKNGVFVEEGMPVNRDGTEWAPYKLWNGDLYECEGCGTLLHIPAREPLAEHYQADYAEQVNRHQPIARIDDC